MKKTKVIKTQEDLSRAMEEENGMFYISMAGSVAMFGGNYAISLFTALEKLEEIALGTSEAIAGAMVEKKRKEAKSYIQVAMQTYLIPFRYH